MLQSEHLTVDFLADHLNFTVVDQMTKCFSRSTIDAPV